MNCWLHRHFRSEINSFCILSPAQQVKRYSGFIKTLIIMGQFSTAAGMAELKHPKDIVKTFLQPITVFTGNDFSPYFFCFS